tara:strand:+ start:906 stop:1157 length:252 start_codon:yes stop_codon:yes gene_type:complete
MIANEYIVNQIDKLIDMVESDGSGGSKPDVQSFQKIFKFYNGRLAEYVVMAHIAQRMVQRAMGDVKPAKKNGNGKKKAEEASE